MKFSVRRGQVALFIIVGILFVASTLFLFFVRREPVVPRGQTLDNPESMIDSCVREQAEETLRELFLQAGLGETNSTVLYNGNRVPYVCLNINYYRPCVAQYPFYLRSTEAVFENAMLFAAQTCFSSVESILRSKGYTIEGGPLNVQAAFKPGLVEVRVLRDFGVRKEGFSKTYTRFDTALDFPAYELVSTASEIVAQEARWCHFSNDGFMVLYPWVDIRVDRLEDSTKIYTLIDKQSSVRLVMAIRGCAIPAGF
jgi:hypothetical protein